MAIHVPNASEVRKAEAIQLRIAGHSQAAVAEKIGGSQQRVSMIELDWLASRKPSAEVTEERRQQMLAAIDDVRARCFSMLDSEVDVGPRLAVVDRIAKLWEREAKLVGLDLERNVQVNVLTAEQMYEVLWAPAEALVVEGTAVEIVDA